MVIQANFQLSTAKKWGVHRRESPKIVVLWGRFSNFNTLLIFKDTLEVLIDLGAAHGVHGSWSRFLTDGLDC